MSIKRDYVVVAAVIGLLIVSFVVGVWLPENKKLKQYQERIAAAELAMGPDFLAPTALDRQQTEIRQLKQELESTKQSIPDSADLAAVLRSVTGAVEAEGVLGQDFQTSAPRHYQKYSEFPIEIDFRETFNTARAVLERIESLPRLVRVDALSFRMSRPEDGQADAAPQMAVTYRLSSFYTASSENEE
ncbi:MAG: type 4a pilus biogenesis protein PilO [Planctomycetota bacterium]